MLTSLSTLPTALRVTGWLHVGLLALALVGVLVDTRLVTGLNPWIKPAKFCLSIVLYVWSLGLLLSWLPAALAGQVRWLSWGVALTMLVETGCIFLQAARGTTSHYNVSSAFNGAVFGLMGLMIFFNTLLNLWAVALVWGQPMAVAPAVAWGARLGLVVFVVGALVGGAMISRGAHTVGASDGGPGLPLVGWSTRAGDLRAAHFLGMHALQGLPLVGWGLTRAAVPGAVLLLVCTAAGWVAVTGLLLVRALNGRAMYF